MDLGNLVGRDGDPDSPAKCRPCLVRGYRPRTASPVLSAVELDTAFAAGKAQLTRLNVRSVRCAHCRRKCHPGNARRLWIDAHKRGFLCLDCARARSPLVSL